MDRTNYRAEYAELLADVRAAPLDMAVLMQLLNEYKCLTDSMNEHPRWSRDVAMQTLDAEVLSELMGKLTRAFVAACAALRG